MNDPLVYFGHESFYLFRHLLLSLLLLVLLFCFLLFLSFLPWIQQLWFLRLSLSCFLDCLSLLWLVILNACSHMKSWKASLNSLITLSLSIKASCCKACLANYLIQSTIYLIDFEIGCRNRIAWSVDLWNFQSFWTSLIFTAYSTKDLPPLLGKIRTKKKKIYIKFSASDKLSLLGMIGGGHKIATA